MPKSLAFWTFEPGLSPTKSILVLADIEEEMGAEEFSKFPFDQARKVFEEVALADNFVDFLTLPAYEIIN